MAAEFVGKVTEKELEESFQNIKNANVSQAEEVFENYDRKVANVENCEILCLDEADKLPSQDFKCMLDRLTSYLPETELKKFSKNYVSGKRVDMSKFPDFNWVESVSVIYVKNFLRI